MDLTGTLDSPYVRRVAISLEYYGIRYRYKPISVFDSFDEFAKINPVVKGPTIVLDERKRASGRRCFDPNKLVCRGQVLRL
jgi:glutathione S-transferase